MKTRVLIVLTVLSALILPGFDPAAAQESVWHVESPVRLSEAMQGTNMSPTQVYVAPDGRHVAYDGRGTGTVCTLDVPTRQPQCVALPDDSGYSFQPNDYFPALRWSPDSTRLALVGVPYTFFRDTDLGLVDLSEPVPTFANLADDGFSGDMRLSGFDPKMILDISPTFSPDGTRIAVERTGVTADGHLAQSTLTIVDTVTGEVRDVSNLPGSKAYDVDAGSIISMDWSPDGTTLAVAIRHVKPDSLYDGVWLVDVASGTWTRQVTLEETHDVMMQLFGDISATMIAAPVRWSPDGTHLLIWEMDPGAYAGVQWVFVMDLESGDITPAILPASTGDQPDPRLMWPIQAGWSPDGSQLLIALHITLPPNATEAVPLVETDEALVTALYLIDVASGDVVLLGHLPLEAAPAFVAAWGADADVIAGGYSFKLVRE